MSFAFIPAIYEGPSRLTLLTITCPLYSIDYNNWRHEQLYPYTGLSEMLNEFNCYIFLCHYFLPYLFDSFLT